MIILTAGTMFIMWLGERITDKGIGNGISLIIMIGIIARMPQSLGMEFLSQPGAAGWRTGRIPGGNAGLVCGIYGIRSCWYRGPDGYRCSMPNELWETSNMAVYASTFP